MSAYDHITDEQLQTAIDNSNSVSAIMRNLGFGNATCPYKRKWVNGKLGSNKFDMTQFDENVETKHPCSNSVRKVDNELIFIKGDKRIAGASLKKRLIEDYDWKDECVECNTGNIWNGKPITLQVDHINGDGTDNRLENLQIICPNCHTQTETFAGRNKVAYTHNGVDTKPTPKTKIPPKVYLCEECEEPTSGKGIKVCRKCHNAKTLEASKCPSKEILEKDIQSTMPMTKIGIKYGVSDNTIRKWCVRLGIPKR
jgi:hypothetical protein